MKRLEELYEKDRPREKLKVKGPAALKNCEHMPYCQHPQPN